MENPFKRITSSIENTYNSYLYRTGRRSWIQTAINSYPPDLREQAKGYIRDLTSTQTASDPNLFFPKLLEFSKFTENVQQVHGLKGPAADDVTKSFIIRGSADLFGYRPAGSRIWNYFANPMGVFSYLSEQYWAVRRSIDLIREAIDSDGFVLRGAKGVSRKRLLETYKRIKELGIDELRIELAAHLQTYGNAWILPHKSLVNGVKELELLYPNRLLPVFDRTTESIIQWEYVIGRIRRIYSKNKLLHLRLNSLQGKEIGSPPLVSEVTEIETALMAMNFNNTVFQKGGLIGTIVSLEQPKDNDMLATGMNQQWVREVQAQFDYLYSGAKAGQGVVALNNVKNVHKLSNPGDLDTSFREGRDLIDKRVGMLLGIPAPKLGIPTSDTYQNAVTENVVNAQFDATINRLTNKVDDFINEEIMKNLLGIYDIKIVPSGRFGAMTLAAAQSLFYLAKAGLITTVNEARTKILGWEALPPNDPRGNLVLDVSINRDPESLQSILAPEPLDPDLELIQDLVGSKSFDFNSPDSIQIKVGGKNNQEFLD